MYTIRAKMSVLQFCSFASINHNDPDEWVQDVLVTGGPWTSDDGKFNFQSFLTAS